MDREISLRPVLKKDVALIYQWRNHAEVRRLMLHPAPISPAEHQAYWEKRLADPHAVSFVILADEKPVGMLKLDWVEGGQDVGIIVAPEAQGRGVGTLALQALIPLAKRKGIRLLTARIKAGNEASRAVFERSGFVRNGERYELGL